MWVGWNGSLRGEERLSNTTCFTFGFQQGDDITHTSVTLDVTQDTAVLVGLRVLEFNTDLDDGTRTGTGQDFDNLSLDTDLLFFDDFFDGFFLLVLLCLGGLLKQRVEN